MTSNLGSHLIQENAPQMNYDEMKQIVMDVVGQHFRPEFINRIDETVVFHPLDERNIQAIAKIQLDRLVNRMKTRGYQLIISDNALVHIGKVGFDPLFGARPLKRAIQQALENPLAQQILAGKLLPNKAIVVDYQNDKVVATQSVD